MLILEPKVLAEGFPPGNGPLGAMNPGSRSEVTRADGVKFYSTAATNGVNY